MAFVNPHWEHGYRCHGYWSEDGSRLGVVSLGPRNLWDGVYRWWIDSRPNDTHEAPNLRSAKRAVERAVNESK